MPTLGYTFDSPLDQCAIARVFSAALRLTRSLPLSSPFGPTFGCSISTFPKGLDSVNHENLGKLVTSPSLCPLNTKKESKSGLTPSAHAPLVLKASLYPRDGASRLMFGTPAAWSSAASFQSSQFSVAPARDSDHGLPGLAVKKRNENNLACGSFLFLKARSYTIVPLKLDFAA